MTERERPKYSWAQKKAALARQLAPFRSRMAVLIAGDTATAVGNGVIPLITGALFDALVSPRSVVLPLTGPASAWAALLALWATIQLGTNLLTWAVDRNQRRLTTELEAGVQARAFARLLTLPVAFAKTHRTGEITNTVDRSGWMLSSLVNTVLSVGPQLLSVLIGIGISFAIRPSLALVLVAGVGLYLLVLIRALPATAERQERAFAVWKRAYGDAADAYVNLQTVKHAGAEEYEEQRIRHGFFEGAIPAWYRLERLWSNLNASQHIVVTLTQLAMFAYSALLILHGELSIGALIAFNAYAGMIIGPFVAIGNQWQTVQNALTTLVSLDEIYQTPAEAYVPEHAVALERLRGDVAFEQVHFSYGPDQAEVLRGVSFEARAGKAVALVGETGVGKSTTVDLVSGYYFATAGRVLVDGHDITKVNLKDLRAQMAVVPQEVVLFNTSIADNIRYGRPGARDEEVHEAARNAHADEFIAKFPKGYDQEVGERGVKLSVGQKQRVAIARAMLRNPRILILDEPTSALDPETEQYISKALEELMRGRTTFIVAHRLSTVRKANLILVLKDGLIAERGTHNELFALPNGIYRHLYELHVGLHE